MLSSFGCFLMHVAASRCPAWPQPRVNDGTHHGSARSHPCPRQEAGWLRPSSTPAHPSRTPKSSGWGLPPAHACCSGGGRASAAEAGAAVPGPRLAVAPEQPPSPAGRVWWKITRRHEMVHMAGCCRLYRCSRGTHLHSGSSAPFSLQHPGAISPPWHLLLIRVECLAPQVICTNYKLNQFQGEEEMRTRYPYALRYVLYDLLEPHSSSWL